MEATLSPGNRWTNNLLTVLLTSFTASGDGDDQAEGEAGGGDQGAAGGAQHAECWSGFDNRLFISMSV